jgi:hypothetical protein
MLEDDTAKRYQSADQVLDAVSRLPISPAWNASVDPDLVRWTLQSRTRVNIVEWRRAPRRQEWTAWSEPLNRLKGRKMTLGGSGGVVPANQARAELEAYLGA